MAKKRKKKSKKTTDVSIPAVENDSAKMEGTREEAKHQKPSKNVEEHIAKPPTLGSTPDTFNAYLESLATSELGKRSFPWSEFLIGTAVGGVFSVIVFVFTINYSWNLDKRVKILEYKAASFIDADFDELQQRLLTTMERRLLMSETELSKLKKQIERQDASQQVEQILQKWGIVNRLVNLENSRRKTLDCGSEQIQFADSSTMEKRIVFQQNFKEPPVVLVGTNNRQVIAVVQEVADSYCTVKITVNSGGATTDTLFWLAVR